jgi:hypothetical protein
VSLYSGNQREARRPDIPHKKRRRNGKKIRLWIPQRILDCRKSLLWRRPSRINVPRMEKTVLENRVPRTLLSTAQTFLPRL